MKKHVLPPLMLSGYCCVGLAGIYFSTGAQEQIAKKYCQRPESRYWYEYF